MTSSSDSIFGITCSVVTVPLGATLAVLLAPGPNVLYTRIKYQGGTGLSLFGNPQLGAGQTSSISTTFSTLGISALVQGYSNGYNLTSATEILEFRGPTQLYLAAVGSTAFAYVMQGLSAAMPSMQ